MRRIVMREKAGIHRSVARRLLAVAGNRTLDEEPGVHQVADVEISFKGQRDEAADRCGGGNEVSAAL
jgi:hypothetical protein